MKWWAYSEDLITNFFFPFSIMIIILTMNFLSNIQMISNKKILTKKFLSLMSYFFMSLKPKKFNKTMSNLLSSMMLTLMILNVSAVSSFNFATTSQMSVVLYMSMTIWISYITFMITKMTKGFLMHCIPEGTPIYLTWFLFLIELISNMIRPLTVTVRLVANILAGHLLLILLSKLVFTYTLAVTFYILLNLIELFVAMIQAYIFVTMLTLYYSEME